ncbi:hypothetical protein AB0958_19095 [Streptomyces sp. NPDC006655]|uniref:hypothetical protein n=1 Tax=Streptomyces sp. NPDC006655 TaxID=3156898 RepID=UPI003454F1A3
MTTSTLAPPTGRRRIPAAHLTDTQAQFVLGHVLTRLGTADGLADDQPPVPYTDRAERLSLSAVAAWSLGLALTPDAEIAQCYDCADIVDGALTDEDAGIIRCHRCRHDHRAIPPSHSYEPWADFYRS